MHSKIGRDGEFGRISRIGRLVVQVVVSLAPHVARVHVGLSSVNSLQRKPLPLITASLHVSYRPLLMPPVDTQKVLAFLQSSSHKVTHRLGDADDRNHHLLLPDPE